MDIDDEEEVGKGNSLFFGSGYGLEQRLENARINSMTQLRRVGPTLRDLPSRKINGEDMEGPAPALPEVKKDNLEKILFLLKEAERFQFKKPHLQQKIKERNFKFINDLGIIFKGCE